MTYSDYEREILADIENDIRQNSPVLEAFSLVRFTSRKNRKSPTEVALVFDKFANTYTSWHLFQFDEIASELLDCEDSENIFIEILLDGSSEPDR